MRRKVLIIGLPLALGIGAGMIGYRIINAQEEPVKRTVLLQTDLAGMEGKEGRLVLSQFAPGAAVGKHYHPGHEFVYVVEGSGVLEVEGKPPRTVNAGDAFYQPPQQVHDIRNRSKTASTKLLVIFIAEKGQPLVVPVK